MSNPSNRVIPPFGKLAKEIVIRADVKGLIMVDAYNIETGMAKGFRPVDTKVPMDAREMVLALLKIVNDYSTVIFASMGEGVLKHGQSAENQKDHHPGTATGE